MSALDCQCQNLESNILEFRLILKNLGRFTLRTNQCRMVLGLMLCKGGLSVLRIVRVRHLFVRNFHGIHGSGEALLTGGGKFTTEDRLARGAFGVIRRVSMVPPGDATVHLGCGVRPMLWSCKRIQISSPVAGTSSVHRIMVPRLRVVIERWIRLGLVMAHEGRSCTLSQWFQIIDFAWVRWSWLPGSSKTRAGK